jgi:hypothetical protein
MRSDNVVEGRNVIPGLATRGWIEGREADWGKASALYAGLEVRAVNAGESSTHKNYARCRDELWFGIADWLKAGGAIPDDSKLTGELVAVEYAFTPAAKIKVESKDDLRARLGRSPDRADALALAVFTRSQKVARFGTAPFRSPVYTFADEGYGAGDCDDDDDSWSPLDGGQVIYDAANPHVVGRR